MITRPIVKNLHYLEPIQLIYDYCSEIFMVVFLPWHLRVQITLGILMDNVGSDLLV